MLTNNLLLRVPALLLAVTFHEAAHGLVAYWLGDPTAKHHGRLTLNPLVHLDPIGAVALLLVGFGWAKPVPVNPMNFRGDRHRGMLLVGLAGPVTNFILALLLLFIILQFPALGGVPYLAQTIVTAYFINIFLGVFNLIPVPPLDGSRVLSYFLPTKARYQYGQWEQYGPFILMILILLPVGFLGRVLYPMARAADSIIRLLAGFLTGGF